MLSPKQKAWLAQGLCRWCGAERGAKSTPQLCDFHTAKARAYATEVKVRYKKSATCVECGNTREHGRSRCRKCLNRHREAHRNQNRGRKTRHGVTAAMYNDMLAAQQGLCAICRQPPLPNKQLGLDHCHVTGRARDLLCDRCNFAIGLMKDSPVLLSSAIAYLDRHASVHPLTI